MSVGLLGFASGLPLALTGSTLQAWLTTEGVSLKTIGAMSLVGLPYLYKFLWAPLLDRFRLPGLGRRRGWLLLTQGVLAVLFWILAASDPHAHLSVIVGVVLSLAWVSATQDIVVDAYRAEILPPEERGYGAGLSVAGYRLAMVVSGAGVLLAADRLGFATSFHLLSVLMTILMGITWWTEEPPPPAPSEASLWTDVTASWRSLYLTPGFKTLAAFVVLYKLGDAFAGSLTMAFFLRGQGFTLTEIGVAYKVLGMVAAITGGIAGGLWMRRLGLYGALWRFGLLQAITNLGFLGLALYGKSLTGMMVAVALENLSAGMGTSALVALLTGLCVRRYTATHFAMLSALTSMPRVLIGPLAGEIANLGWPVFFSAAVVLSLPGLVLLRVLRVRLMTMAS